MKAYMELVNNMLLTAEVRTSIAVESHSCTSKATKIFFNLSDDLPRQLYIQWCDDATAAEVRICSTNERWKEFLSFPIFSYLFFVFLWPIDFPSQVQQSVFMASQLHPGLSEAVGGPQEDERHWLGREKPGAGVWLSVFRFSLAAHWSQLWLPLHSFIYLLHKLVINSSLCVFQVYEDVSQCCQALSQRLGTQPYFFNKQYVLLWIYRLLSVMHFCQILFWTQQLISEF